MKPLFENLIIINKLKIENKIYMPALLDHFLKGIGGLDVKFYVLIIQI